VCVFQVTKDIEDAENFLDHVSSKTDTDMLCSDPQQLSVKLAEDEVRAVGLIVNIGNSTLTWCN